MSKKVILIAALSLSMLCSLAKADTISIRADLWCPFNCDPSGAKPGYMIEIAKAVFEPLGHKIDYQTLNWARAIA
jgi:polar amino acid transport system substrate-binding protein